jgi:hypothetical protein
MRFHIKKTGFFNPKLNNYIDKYIEIAVNYSTILTNM